jgi:ubiquinone/menaquinone biosynthesis C-methylase UbiE
MLQKDHWEQVYAAKAPDAVSWFAPHLCESLAYIDATGLPKSASVVDVGGGESTLVDDLVADGFTAVTVLELSSKALDVARSRMGTKASDVRWISADVLDHPFEPASVDVWHDRAVFHFLTTAEQRQAYVDQVMRALRPGGYCIVGAFGPKGPLQCSGLPVARYDASELHGEFGAAFQLMGSRFSTHVTPWGTPQQFVYCFCRRMQ